MQTTERLPPNALPTYKCWAKQTAQLRLAACLAVWLADSPAGRICRWRRLDLAEEISRRHRGSEQQWQQLLTMWHRIYTKEIENCKTGYKEMDCKQPQGNRRLTTANRNSQLATGNWQLVRLSVPGNWKLDLAPSFCPTLFRIHRWTFNNKTFRLPLIFFLSFYLLVFFLSHIPGCAVFKFSRIWHWIALATSWSAPAVGQPYKKQVLPPTWSGIWKVFFYLLKKFLLQKMKMA